MDQTTNREYEYKGLCINGFLMIFFTFILLPALMILIIINTTEDTIGRSVAILLPLFFIFILGCVGYFVQEPNVARVMIFFGKYKGTCKKVGYFWVNPFLNRKKLSLRIRNMDIEPIKVNDKIGNPVLIGMVLVWRIRDTYKVVFDLDSQSLGGQTNSISNQALQNFVRIQSDAALREVTGHFAYDQTDSGTSNELTLRDSGQEINDLLEKKINERLAMAGMEVVEARINYLAYAPEIAAVMLRRQQASAIITAREKIVEGAVSMVEMALTTLEEKNVVTLSNDQKASMVGNLLAVLCADEPLTPTLNANV
ncbi:MAG: SPFH domain-containing protein [Bacteroidales bacterium]|nr:SPFH domain-containing protein [Bacteroidales bacterium]MBD5288438.1 SPFH domain-containing protein [Bacteroides sp.]MBD5386483.1 SPFH domain-containing protein [bacterium]MDE6255185.1 SPFH domain-containing protein [Muribaculaceae bacterium]